MRSFSLRLIISGNEFSFRVQSKGGNSKESNILSRLFRAYSGRRCFQVFGQPFSYLSAAIGVA
jgi:hypothetical protein